MWILSLEWLVLAVAVFWATGAFKRLKRLRAAARDAFGVLDVQFVQALQVLRDSADGSAPADATAAAMARRARTALLASANLLQAALAKARLQPLNAELLASLDSAWQSLQVAWQSHVQQDVGNQEVADVFSPDSEVQRWVALMVVHQHHTEQFNAAVADYNRAIGQFPACLLARVAGLKPGRLFQKDAALYTPHTA